MVVTNRAKDARKHALGIGAYALRFNREMKGSLGRVPPFQTEVSCAKGKEVTRKSKDDFKSGWFSVPSTDRYAAISNYYFGQALVDAERLEGPSGFYASPVGAAGRIYLAGRNGTSLVLKQGDKIEVLATNILDDKFDASPAIAGKELYLRGHENLYCLAE